MLSDETDQLTLAYNPLHISLYPYLLWWCKEKKIPQSVNPFMLAEKGEMPKNKEDDCRRAVTNFTVKGFLPFLTVETPW